MLFGIKALSPPEALSQPLPILSLSSLSSPSFLSLLLTLSPIFRVWTFLSLTTLSLSMLFCHSFHHSLHFGCHNHYHLLHYCHNKHHHLICPHPHHLYHPSSHYYYYHCPCSLHPAIQFFVFNVIIKTDQILYLVHHLLHFPLVIGRLPV